MRIFLYLVGAGIDHPSDPLQLYYSMLRNWWATWNLILTYLSRLHPSCRLKIPNLGIDDKYKVILQNYGHDIEMVSKLYSRQKNDPPLARNLPPMAGKILWARQLFHRIQEPMSLFQKHSTVLQTAEAKPIIRNYNRVAKVLLEFEIVYHRGWLQQVSFHGKHLHNKFPIAWLVSIKSNTSPSICLYTLYFFLAKSPVNAAWV